MALPPPQFTVTRPDGSDRDNEPLWFIFYRQEQEAKEALNLARYLEVLGALRTNALESEYKLMLLETRVKNNRTQHAHAPIVAPLRRPDLDPLEADDVAHGNVPPAPGLLPAPAEFPATAGGFGDLSDETLTDLLEAYDLPVDGDAAARRERLCAFAGVAPYY